MLHRNGYSINGRDKKTQVPSPRPAERRSGVGLVTGAVGILVLATGTQLPTLEVVVAGMPAPSQSANSCSQGSPATLQLPKKNKKNKLVPVDVRGVAQLV